MDAEGIGGAAPDTPASEGGAKANPTATWHSLGIFETSWQLEEAIRARLTTLHSSIIKTSQIEDPEEVARVAVLLPADATGWVARKGVRKRGERWLRYRGLQRLLVIVELEEPKVGSQTAAAQLDALENLLQLTPMEEDGAGEGDGALPWFWALHQETTTKVLMSKMIVAKELRGWLGVLGCPTCLEHLAQRCGLALGESSDDAVRLVANHFGGDVAFTIAWGRYYVHSLWILMMFIIPMSSIIMLLRESDEMAVPIYDETFGSFLHVLWELLKFVLVVWLLLMAKFWPKQDLEGGVPPEKEKRMVPGWTSRGWIDKGRNAFCVAAALSLLVGIVNLAVAQLMFVCVFWWELWLAYEWGDCINLGCRDPEEKYGFWGWLAGICPGILEAILFEAFKGFSGLTVDFLCWIRHFKNSVKRRAFYAGAALVLESVGKLGTFGILAFLFVPEWDDETELAGLPDDFLLLSAIDQRIARNNVDCSDLPEVQILGRGSLRCLRRRLDPSYRRWLFMKAMKGPFVVAPFIAILIKVLLPMVLRLWVACMHRYERRKRRRGQGRPCCCYHIWVGIVRIAALIFTFDCANVGGLKFILHGHPFADGERPVEVKSEEEAEARQRAAEAEPKEPELPVAEVRQAVSQALRRKAEPRNAMLDMQLSIMWVAFFTPIWPWGCLPTLLAWVLHTRSDWGKLLYVKRRTFPNPAEINRPLTIRFLYVIAHWAVLWHVGLSVLVYNSWLTNVTPGLIAGIWVGAAVGATLAMHAVAWAVHRFVVQRFFPWAETVSPGEAVVPEPHAP